MESPSTLELFLLHLIAEGVVTQYDLLKVAGLSVGSSSPALSRLKNRGLVEASPAGARRRSEYKLTRMGRALLRRQLVELITEAQIQDTDSLFRAVAIALKRREVERAREWLNNYAAGVVRVRREIPKSRNRLLSLYRFLMTELEKSRVEADRKLIAELVGMIENIA